LQAIFRSIFVANTTNMRYFLSLLIICSFSIAKAQHTGKIKNISAKKLERKAKSAIQLVDVRTGKEFAESCVENALNINVEDSLFTKKIEGLDKNKPVYVYCRSGKRAAKAAETMKDAGFTKVYNLKGGILAWDKRKNK
jgi:phage shock protein E